MGNGNEPGCDADCETGSRMSQMLEQEWAGMNERVSSPQRDWLWDSIRWMMAELDRWAPSPRPLLACWACWARWLDTRLHHDGVGGVGLGLTWLA